MSSAATLLLVIGLGLELHINGIANGESSSTDQASFWMRKIKIYFYCMDADGNGVVAEDDFQQLSDRFILTDNGNEDRKEKIRNLTLEFYKGYSWVAGGPVFKVSAFIEGLRKKKDSEEFKAAYKSLSAGLFGVLDLNGDGSIDNPELARMLRCFLIRDSENAAVKAVKAADTNGDGSLDLTEFIIAKLDFITSDDKNGPGRWILGPLRDTSGESGGLSIHLGVGI